MILSFYIFRNFHFTYFSYHPYLELVRYISEHCYPVINF